MTAVRGRFVTYGLIVLLIVGVATETEAWPITSWRLFSGLRTDLRISTTFTIVGRDGTEFPLRLPGDAMAATRHQFSTLARQDPAGQRAKVRAWLEAADVELDRVDHIRLERRRLRLDPDGAAPIELGRTTILEITP